MNLATHFAAANFWVMKFAYLLTLLIAVIVPAIFAPDRRLRLYREWRNLLRAILYPSVVFVIWDAVATARQHWSFNYKYMLGPHLGNLPLEEYLFYLVIGFVTIYTYEVVRYFRGERR